MTKQPLKNYANPYAKQREYFRIQDAKEKKEAEQTRKNYHSGKPAMGRNE